MPSDDDVLQTKCWISTEGHMWMEGFYDELPHDIRRRLQLSMFNLCPACLVTKFAPQVRSQHPGYSREKALLAAIEVMEAELRSGRSSKRR
jgi:hypothetical protein